MTGLSVAVALLLAFFIALIIANSKIKDTYNLAKLSLVFAGWLYIINNIGLIFLLFKASAGSKKNSAV